MYKNILLVCLSLACVDQARASNPALCSSTIVEWINSPSCSDGEGQRQIQIASDTLNAFRSNYHKLAHDIGQVEMCYTNYGTLGPQGTNAVCKQTEIVQYYTPPNAATLSEEEEFPFIKCCSENYGDDDCEYDPADNPFGCPFQTIRDLIKGTGDWCTAPDTNGDDYLDGCGANTPGDYPQSMICTNKNGGATWNPCIDKLNAIFAEYDAANAELCDNLLPAGNPFHPGYYSILCATESGSGCFAKLQAQCKVKEDGDQNIYPMVDLARKLNCSGAAAFTTQEAACEFFFKLGSANQMVVSSMVLGAVMVATVFL